MHPASPPRLQTLEGKQEWIMRPDMPVGMSRPGLLELAAATVQTQRLASGGGAAVLGNPSANGSGAQLVNAETK